jgi:hypothetical protein
VTGAALAFNAEKHEYRLPDGAIVPSVTQVLRAVGVSTDFESLKDVSYRNAAAIDRKRDIGHALHADAHAFDDNDLDWATVHPDVRPWLEAWEEFRNNTGLIPLTRERVLYSPTLNVCGTLDGIFCHPSTLDRRVLIDTKTGDPKDSAAEFQTAGYEILWTDEHPNEPIAERLGVQLTPGKRVPYRIHNYSAMPDAWTHGPKFRAFVTTYWCQQARRKRR